MKRIVLFILFFSAITCLTQAQKFAIVDIDYLMKNIPAYESANEQINQISKKWQNEIDSKTQEIQSLYKNYQTEIIFLSDEMKSKREEEILSKEKAMQELKRSYFGSDGELFKKRQSLIKPIQDEIYTAIQEISKEKDLGLVIDKSSSMNMIYISTKLDISDLVLQKLGYSK